MRITEIIHIDKRCVQVNWGTTTAHTLRAMSSNAHYARWRVAYLLGHKQPRYPVPALQTKAVYDYSDVRWGRVIGLQLFERYSMRPGWDARLIEYWSRD